MLRESLLRILSELSTSREDTFSQNPLANFIRGTAADDVEEALGGASSDIKVQGSAGAGNWATVPWISVFDLTVTNTATGGYYIVYLFHPTEPVVHLSLNQGTTTLRKEYSRNARAVMRGRAQAIRFRLHDFTDRFPVQEISLGSDQTLPMDYEAAHSIGLTYTAADMPSEEKLRDDLQTLVRAYRVLTFRGGLDPSAEVSEVIEVCTASKAATLTEIRRYRHHRRIERNTLASKLVKSRLGTRCQCCDFDFEEAYGGVGKGYIEVHHLKPLSTLQEGEPVSYDIVQDFAVLCANCHRMIHRQTDPSDLAALKSTYRVSRTQKRTCDNEVD